MIYQILYTIFLSDLTLSINFPKIYGILEKEYFLIFQLEYMLKLCLNFNESRPIYAYKCYAYKKIMYIKILKMVV